MDRTTTNRLADEAARLLGRQEVGERHFDVFAVTFPATFDGGNVGDLPLPRVILIQPRPRVVEKQITIATEQESGGTLQALLQRFELSISRRYSDADLRPDFFLILLPGTEVTRESSTEIRPRYRAMGTPAPMQDEWKLTVVEER